MSRRTRDKLYPLLDGGVVSPPERGTRDKFLSL
jgi:hypothetical protein